MELHCEIRGSSEINLLFLHGFMGNGEDWAKVLPFFEDNHRCIVPDLPGHGKSATLNRGADWSIENTAASVIDCLAQCNARRSVVIGYSMGGRLALYLAVLYPQYFQGAILESASPGLATTAERKLRIRNDGQLATLLEGIPLGEFLDNWYGAPLFETLRSHPKFPEIFRRRLQNDPAALAKSLREMGTGQQPSLWGKLKSAKIPLLLVVGEKDAKFRAIAAEMCRKNPAIMQEVVSGAGHNIHVEQPHAFADVVMTFLNGMYDSSINPL